jgi:flagellar basal body-associated protein FliL
MSEKAEKKSEAGAEGEPKKKGGVKALLTKTPVMLGGVMLIEAVVLFAGFKVLGGSPKPVEAAELHGEAAHDEHGEGTSDPNKRVEMPLVEFRAPNKLTGRTLLFDVSIYVSVKKTDEETVKASIEQRKAMITDRVRTIIAQSDPERLGGGSEPGLETLRRQVKYQLDQILGEGVVQEVIVPRCIPFRADF